MKIAVRPAAPMLLLILLTGLPAGCSWFHSKPQAVVPVMQTAAEQYAYAMKFRDQRRAELITDDDKFLDARDVILDTFSKVPENFPDDRQVTPLAKLDVIDMQCGLDNERGQRLISGKKKKLHQGIEDLATLAQQYPENERIQAKTLYDRGLCHKLLGEYDEMQACFKAVRDKWANSNDKLLQDLARMADYYYKQTYIKNQ